MGELTGPSGALPFVANRRGLLLRLPEPAVPCSACAGSGCAGCGGLGAWVTAVDHQTGCAYHVPVPPDDATSDAPCPEGKALLARIRAASKNERRLGVQWRTHFLGCRPCYLVWAAMTLAAAGVGDA